MTHVIVISKEELIETINNCLIEHEKSKYYEHSGKTLTINKVAKRLGKSHSTISSYIKKGILKSTANGLITEYELNEFLKSK